MTIPKTCQVVSSILPVRTQLRSYWHYFSNYCFWFTNVSITSTYFPRCFWIIFMIIKVYNVYTYDTRNKTDLYMLSVNTTFGQRCEI